MAAAGPVAYEVFRGTARVGRTEDTRAVDPDLLPGTRYCYAVRAVDVVGQASAPSASACAQTLDESPPAPPSGVAGYEVLRAEVRVGAVTGTALREENLAAGMEHCWTVSVFPPVR